MKEQDAWERFTETGSVASYLAYCRAKQQAEMTAEREEEKEEGRYADPD